jgi:Uma2 family endonuclease
MSGDWYDPASMDYAAQLFRRLPAPPAGDQIVVLHKVPWEQYDALCRASEDSAGPRMAYLDGDLEIVSPGIPHEGNKKLLARLLEADAEEMGISLNGLGSTTFRRKAKKAGVEPDECYCIGPIGRLPDFAIEVVHTSGGIDKLEVYRRLRVPEVWFHIEGRIYVYRLLRNRYREQKRSSALPKLDIAEIEGVVANADEDRQTEAVRGFRRNLRRRGG